MYKKRTWKTNQKHSLFKRYLPRALAKTLTNLPKKLSGENMIHSTHPVGILANHVFSLLYVQNVVGKLAWKINMT